MFNNDDQHHELDFNQPSGFSRETLFGDFEGEGEDL